VRPRQARLVLVTVLVAGLCIPPAAARAATAGRGGCSNGYWDRRDLAGGRFFDKRWELEFFRDHRGRPCLVDSWSRYASIFRFRVREHRPRLALLNLNATSSGARSVYVMEGYVQRRVARMTFRIDGSAREVRIVRSPRWTRLPKDLFIHLVGGRRYDRDATGRLRAYDRDGRLLATRVLRRGQFYERARLD
jgi:hypothetical protein